MAPNWPIPWGVRGLRRSAARSTCGAICLSSSNHFAPMPYSQMTNPVALPPCAKLATNPAPTGSGVYVNTTGTVLVAWSIGPTTEPPEAKITSGASATSSAAYFREALRSPAAQRIWIRTLRPSVQPNSCRPCTNAARRTCPCRSSSAKL
jgi:hypothetical protein